MNISCYVKNKLSKSEIIKAEILIAFIILIFSIMGYHLIYGNNVKKSGYLLIPQNSTFANVSDLIKPFLKDEYSFKRVANLRAYPKNIKSGRYFIENGLSNHAVLTKLKNGYQEPLTVVFNNENSVAFLAGSIASKIEVDSLSIITAICDSLFLKDHQLNNDNVLSIFIPNSYEVYWNISAKKFRDRMYDEFHKFWQTNNRLAKADSLNLNPIQVYILASIIQKETAKVDERNVVAGLYLNRLKLGWPLQADPTIIFALKRQFQNDTIIKRVIKKDLLIKSAYNTYTNTGLPPGPIAMPDISSIDAVLNPAKHNYLFMCASTKNIGYHEFTNDSYHHNINAAKYQRWLNKQGIKR